MGVLLWVSVSRETILLTWDGPFALQVCVEQESFYRREVQLCDRLGWILFRGLS